MQTLNIIGCGNVGKALGRLWHQHSVFQIGDVINRSTASSREAVDFLGSGRAISTMKQMNPAQVFMLGVPDDHILSCCNELAMQELIQPGNIVFHCSGALPSGELRAVKASGAEVASVHPVKSFADPVDSAATFAGTFCGLEGDAAAEMVVCEAFEAIGARIFSITSERKTMYHTAMVFVSNYLTALIELGVRTSEKAGLQRETAFQVLQPLVRETVENIFKNGTEKALTGPIARGDHKLVAKQLDSLSDWDPQIAMLYRGLGAIALDLSQSKKALSEKSFIFLERLLKSHPE